MGFNMGIFMGANMGKGLKTGHQMGAASTKKARRWRGGARAAAIGACAALSLATAGALGEAACAIPAAALSGRVAGAEMQEDGGFRFTLGVSVSESADAYCAMDFNVVSSDHARLHILDLAAEPDEKLFEISFAEDFGTAYHKGRVDEATGEIDYLVGIFDQSSQNGIKDAMDVCGITFVYEGGEPQTIRLENLQLVYFDAEGAVRSEKRGDAAVIEISEDALLAAAAGGAGEGAESGGGAGAAEQIADEETPLGAAEPESGALGAKDVAIAVLALAVAALAIVAFRKRRIAAAPAGARGGAWDSAAAAGTEAESAAGSAAGSVAKSAAESVTEFAADSAAKSAAEYAVGDGAEDGYGAEDGACGAPSAGRYGGDSNGDSRDSDDDEPSCGDSDSDGDAHNSGDDEPSQWQ
jgi:hypothetical protein